MLQIPAQPVQLPDHHGVTRTDISHQLGQAWAVIVGAIAGATGLRLVQYGILGAAFGTGVQLIALHNIVEAALRPARVSLAGDTGIGDSLPRSRPTFAVRSNVSVVAVAFSFGLGGAMLAAVFNRTSEIPGLAVVIGGGLALGFAGPISVGLGFSPSLQPIRDLAQGAERVAAGDYSQRLPVVQDDDLGALAAHPAKGGQQPQLAVDYLRSRMPMMTGKTNVRPVDGPAVTDRDKH